MIRLTDMQLVLLNTACQRDDGSLLPPSESLGDQATAVRKAIEALLKKDLAVEKEGLTTAQLWRSDGDLTIGVVVTKAGRAIIDPPATADSGEGGAGSKPDGEAAPPSPRPATKQSMVLDLLKREGGTTLGEIVETTGWLPHTSRAVLTGLRKKGHDIAKDKVDGSTRYTIRAAA